jgi:hypothetical protein
MLLRRFYMFENSNGESRQLSHRHDGSVSVYRSPTDRSAGAQEEDNASAQDGHPASAIFRDGHPKNQCQTVSHARERIRDPPAWVRRRVAPADDDGQGRLAAGHNGGFHAFASGLAATQLWLVRMMGHTTILRRRLRLMKAAGNRKARGRQGPGATDIVQRSIWV